MLDILIDVHKIEAELLYKICQNLDKISYSQILGILEACVDINLKQRIIKNASCGEVNEKLGKKCLKNLNQIIDCCVESVMKQSSDLSVEYLLQLMKSVITFRKEKTGRFAYLVVEQLQNISAKNLVSLVELAECVSQMSENQVKRKMAKIVSDVISNNKIEFLPLLQQYRQQQQQQQYQTNSQQQYQLVSQDQLMDQQSSPTYSRQQLQQEQLQQQKYQQQSRQQEQKYGQEYARRQQQRQQYHQQQQQQREQQQQYQSSVSGEGSLNGNGLYIFQTRTIVQILKLFEDVSSVSVFQKMSELILLNKREIEFQIDEISEIMSVFSKWKFRHKEVMKVFSDTTVCIFERESINDIDQISSLDQNSEKFGKTDLDIRDSMSISNQFNDVNTSIIIDIFEYVEEEEEEQEQQQQLQEQEQEYEQQQSSSSSSSQSSVAAQQQKSGYGIEQQQQQSSSSFICDSSQSRSKLNQDEIYSQLYKCSYQKFDLQSKQISKKQRDKQIAKQVTHFCNIMQKFVYFGFVPPHKLIEQFQIITSFNLQLLSLGDLERIIYFYTFLNAILMESNQDQISQQINNKLFIQSIQKQNKSMQELVYVVMEKLGKNYGIDNSQRSRILHNLYRLYLISNFFGQEINLKNDILEQAKKVFMQFSERQESGVSLSQREVFLAVKRAGFNLVELETASGGGGAPIDIYVQFNNKKIALEFDGPFHFCANQPYCEMGPTIVRRVVLKRLGYVVVNIPWFEWSKVRINQREEWVKKIIDQCIVDSSNDANNIVQN